MTTFGMEFVMEPLMGDRPNDPDRVPHYFVVIAERDDMPVRKIFSKVCIPFGTSCEHVSLDIYALLRMRLS